MEFTINDNVEVYPHHKALVEWCIHDLFSLSRKADTIFYSKEFNFSNASWQFKLYPNGQRANQSVNYMSLYLVRVSAAENQSNSLRLRMGIRSSNGGTFSYSDGTYCFDDNFEIFGWSRFIERAQLQRNWYRIGQTGSIKLFCDITEDLPNLSVTTQTVSFDGIDGLSKNFDSLFHSQRKSDVTLKVQDQEFCAHKLVLETRSSVFAAMFEHDMKENSTGIVCIDDCDPDVFQSFLTFIYTGKIEKLSPENAPRLFALSDKYDVAELKTMCLNLMSTSLSVDIVCDVMATADRYDEKELRESSKKLIIDNIKMLIKTDQWIEFMKDHTLLASEVLMSVIL